MLGVSGDAKRASDNEEASRSATPSGGARRSVTATRILWRIALGTEGRAFLHNRATLVTGILHFLSSYRRVSQTHKQGMQIPSGK